MDSFVKSLRGLIPLAAALLGVSLWHSRPASGGVLREERLRVIIETDAGGDPDDEQSLVRFLLYVNEWDVEGIIVNREHAREGENLNPERTGLGIVRRMILAYEQCLPSLRQHDARYPRAESLLKKTVSGIGREGVDLIIAAVDKRDPRPIWYCNWGTDWGTAPSSLKQALDKVLEERGNAGYARFKSRLRLSSDDQFGDHTTAIAPLWNLWVDTFRPEIDRRRWYHRFSALTATAGGFDIERDVRSGHGPLGALYPINTTHRQKEGDSMTFLYLIPTGMNDPNHPEWGSWGGRYAVRDPQRPTYYWATAEDSWKGSRHRENTLARWAADLQNDFRARMDWCVRPYGEANHKPVALLNGRRETGIQRLVARPGDLVVLTSRGSRDPDGDLTRIEWIDYPEAGTYGKSSTLQEADSERVWIRIPLEAAGKSIHFILAVRDDGDPPLVDYRRVIIEVSDTPLKMDRSEE